MTYIVAKDNLNRDYHNDILVAIFANKSMATAYCKTNNHEHASQHYIIVESIDELMKSMTLSSFYDVNGSVPDLKQFLNFTGLSIVPINIAKEMFNQHYNVND